MITKQTKLEWLLETAEAIERNKLGEIGFDMKHWGSCGLYQHCMTAACLGGHYVLRHPESGLYMEQQRHNRLSWDIVDQIDPILYRNMAAMWNHFDFMNSEDAAALFDPMAYERRGTPAEVVARVRATVARYEEQV